MNTNFYIVEAIKLLESDLNIQLPTGKSLILKGFNSQIQLCRLDAKKSLVPVVTLRDVPLP